MSASFLHCGVGRFKGLDLYCWWFSFCLMLSFCLCCFYSVFLFSFQFLSLASNILNFITSSMLNSRNNFIRNYLSVSLSEQHMATLASIIKEVDKDGLKGERANLSARAVQLRDVSFL